MTGLEEALRLGADVIVNVDADNQYNADDIPGLTAPILAGEAEMVIGTRPIDTIRHFSWIKKALQKLGSWAVRVASGTSVPDSPSGFRAISRSAAQRLSVISEYTYTLETLIQAGRSNIAVASVPVQVNADMRPSRLVRSNASYVVRSLGTIVRMFVVYKPFRFFGFVGALLVGGGMLLGIRFLFEYVGGDGEGHVQSLILAAVLLVTGFQAFLAAFLADMLAANRKLIEDLRYRLAKAMDDEPGRPR